MEEQNQLNAIAAFFPGPPPFYKHFTKANTARMKALKDAESSRKISDAPNAAHGIASSSEAAEDLGSELIYLVPPKPPVSGIFKCFGETIDINNPLPSLRDQGIEQVYPSPPSTPSGIDSSDQAAHRAKHLSKITKSILLSYLELVGALSVNPSLWRKKVEDLQVLYYNAHHLINEYRAHHSRHMLIELMEQQLEQKRGEISSMQAMKEKVESILSKVGTDEIPALDGEQDSNENLISRQVDQYNQKRIWEALDNL